MKKQDIVITFEEDGTFEIEANGFTGTSCKVATKPFEDALGKMSETKAKPEAMRRERKNVNSRLR